jgi:hypothetical protein
MYSSGRYRRQAGARDLLYFATPRLWHHYPFLPVIRRPAGSREIEYGVLYDAGGVSGTYGYRCTVFLTNLFTLPRTEAGLFARPRHVYDSFEDLANDGWVVD